MIEIVEDFIIFLLKKSKKISLPIDKVTHYLINNPGKHSLDWLADQASLCQRQFYRQFMAHRKYLGIDVFKSYFCGCKHHF